MVPCTLWMYIGVECGTCDIFSYCFASTIISVLGSPSQQTQAIVLVLFRTIVSVYSTYLIVRVFCSAYMVEMFSCQCRLKVKLY